MYPCEKLAQLKLNMNNNWHLSLHRRDISLSVYKWREKGLKNTIITQRLYFQKQFTIHS